MSTMSRTRQVVLTGATGPIGRHVAERLAERGHALALVVKDRAKGEALAATLRATSPRGLSAVEVFEADLSSVVSVQALVKTLSSKLTHVDVLVNAAAVTSPSPTRETSAEGVERTFATNALAPFQLMMGLAPLLSAASGRKLGGNTPGGRGALTENRTGGKEGATSAKPTLGGGMPFVKDAGPMLAVPTTPQAVVALSGGLGTQQENSSSSSLPYSGTKASMARIVNLCWATSASPWLVSSSSEVKENSSSQQKMGTELREDGAGKRTNEEGEEERYMNASKRRDEEEEGKSSPSTRRIPPNFHGRLQFGFPPTPTPPWLLRCAEDEALAREEQRKKQQQQQQQEKQAADDDAADATAGMKNKNNASASTKGQDDRAADPWLDAEKKAADRGISDDRQKPFYYTSSSSTTLSRGGRDAKRFRSRATAAMLARERKRVQEEAYARAVKSGWLQRSYNAAVGAEEWFVLEEVNVLALKSHSTSKSNASSTITTKASGSCSSSRHNADSNSSANSSISSPSCSSGGGHSSNRSSVGVDHDIERNVEGAHEGGVYDADEEFLLAAKMGNKGNENTTSSSDRIEKDKQQQQLKGDYEEEDEEEVVGLWSAVAGPFDAYALATGNGYDAQEAFVQSQVAARMLTWAAAAHFKKQNLDVAVHACHSGALATRGLLARGFKDDANGGSLLSARTASSCASFLAADRRIDAMGHGPHYWNERIRVQPCAYMPQAEQCSSLWRTATSIVETAMAAAAAPPPPVK